jgi:hypothetical protein
VATANDVFQDSAPLPESVNPTHTAPAIHIDFTTLGLDKDPVEVNVSSKTDMAPAPIPTPVIVSVVFIDAKVENAAAIIAVIDASAEIKFLDADKDGLAQMADYLRGRSDIDNIQVISHGADGQLYLGDTVVSNAN